MDEETAGADSVSIELRIILLGTLDCGKTLTANTLLGPSSSSTVTSTPSSRSCHLRQGLSHGRRLTLVEAPRWYWSGGRLEASVQEETKRSMTLATPGPHAFLWLIPVKEFTEIERRVPQEIEEMFGAGAMQHCIVVLTCGDYLMGRSAEEYLDKEDPGLREMIGLCEGRYHVVDNRHPDICQQVPQLLKKVERMVQLKGGCYIQGSPRPSSPQPSLVDERVVVKKNTRSVETELPWRTGMNGVTDTGVEERAGSMRLERGRLERERLQKEREEKEKLEKEKEERERMVQTMQQRQRERIERERLEREAEREKIEHEAQRREREQLEGEERKRIAEEAQRKKLERLEREQKEKMDIERQEREREERERMVREEERLKRIQEDIERREKERLDRDRRRREELERVEKERAKQREEMERKEKERLASEIRQRGEQESIEKEREEERRKQEREHQNEDSPKPAIEREDKGDFQVENMRRERIEMEKADKQSTQCKAVLDQKDTEREEKEKLDIEEMAGKEKERIACEMERRERLEIMRTERERMEKERADERAKALIRERAERQRNEREQIEREKLKQEKLKAEKDRIEKEKLETIRKERERVKRQRADRVRAEMAWMQRVNAELLTKEKKEMRKREEERARRTSDQEQEQLKKFMAETELMGKGQVDREHQDEETTTPRHLTNGLHTQRLPGKPDVFEQEFVSKDKHSSRRGSSQSAPEGALPSKLSQAMDTKVLQSMYHRITTGDEPSASSVPELRLVLLGHSGSGKSAAGNTILGRCEFESRAASPVTQQCQKGRTLLGNRRVAVVDTPDWFHSERSPEDVRLQLSSCVALSSPGPHAFLLCVPVHQPPSWAQLQATLGALEAVFGPGAVSGYTLVLFTHSDRLGLRDGCGSEQTMGAREVEEHIASKCPDLLKLVERCGDRYHVLDTEPNESSGDGKGVQEEGRGVEALLEKTKNDGQMEGERGKVEKRERRSVEELLEKVEQTVRESGGGHYSSGLFQEAEDRVREKQEEILQNRRARRLQRERGKMEATEEGEDYRDHGCLSGPLSPLKEDMKGEEEEEVEDEEMEVQRTREEAERSVTLNSVPALPLPSPVSTTTKILQSVGQSIGMGVQRMPKLLAGGTLLGGGIGVFFGGLLGGAVGATGGLALGEVARRKLGQPPMNHTQTEYVKKES